MPCACQPPSRRALASGRQSLRTLQQLLGYNPADVPLGQPGYGGGSGKPDIMFGFVKHLWQCGDRHDALSRCRAGAPCSDLACSWGCKPCWPLKRVRRKGIAAVSVHLRG